MNKQLYANNASAFVETDSGSSITISSADAYKFPSITEEGDYFVITLDDSAGNLEICKVTSRIGNIFTVLRAREGTSAFTFPRLSKVECRLTKGTLENLVQLVETSVEGVVITKTNSATWVLTHNLNRYPNVLTLNNEGEVMIGNISMDSVNQLTVTFSEAVSGKAYLS